METLSYAPVVIPTLNRYDHFKRCLESLEKCSGANKTDVYVGLDYPPSEKYVEGWKKIDKYLNEKSRLNGFRNLFIRKRDYNCGVGHSGGNASLLVAEIKENTDRYIFTEDDNEFSPLFLEFMNQGLEIYKDNPKVTAICGYNPPIDMSDYSYNIYASYGHSGWGCGNWSTTQFEFKTKEIDRLLRKFKVLWKVYKRSPNLVFVLINMLSKKQIWGDTCIPFYNIVYDRFCIFPKTSFVRNWGHDGSGVHCGKGSDLKFINQEINSDKSFVYDSIVIEETKSKAVRDYILKSYDLKKRIRLFYCIIKYYMSPTRKHESE